MILLKNKKRKKNKTAIQEVKKSEELFVKKDCETVSRKLKSSEKAMLISGCLDQKIRKQLQLKEENRSQLDALVHSQVHLKHLASFLHAAEQASSLQEKRECQLAILECCYYSLEQAGKQMSGQSYSVEHGLFSNVGRSFRLSKEDIDTIENLDEAYLLRHLYPAFSRRSLRTTTVDNSPNVLKKMHRAFDEGSKESIEAVTTLTDQYVPKVLNFLGRVFDFSDPLTTLSEPITVDERLLCSLAPFSNASQLERELDNVKRKTLRILSRPSRTISQNLVKQNIVHCSTIQEFFDKLQKTERPDLFATYVSRISESLYLLTANCLEMQRPFERRERQETRLDVVARYLGLSEALQEKLYNLFHNGNSVTRYPYATDYVAGKLHQLVIEANALSLFPEKNKDRKGLDDIWSEIKGVTSDKTKKLLNIPETLSSKKLSQELEKLIGETLQIANGLYSNI